MSGATTIQRISSGSGTSRLVLANTGASNATLSGDVTVKSNSALDLGASNQIADAADLKLDGGTFWTRGFSEGTATASGADVLNLISSSTIDFGGGDSILTFASDARTAGTLTISGWSGNPNNSTTGRYGDQLILDTSTSNIGVANIVFSDWGNATAVITGDLGSGFYEIAPNVTVTDWDKDANGTWGTGTNWSPTTAPDAADKVVLLSKALTADRTITLSSGKTLGVLQITGGSSGNDYTVTGSTLTFDVSAGNSSISQLGDDSATIASAIALNDNLTIMNSSSNALTISGAISGASKAVTLESGGTVNFSGANTYTGDTNINNGTLNLTGSIASSLLINEGAILAGGNGATTVSSKGLTLDGGTISPGNSTRAQLTIGDDTSDSVSWSSGTYIWEVGGGLGDSGSNSSSGGGDTYNEAAGTPGSSWDYISFTGTLDLSNAYENSIKIEITSVGSTGWVSKSEFIEMKIADANSITGFNASYFDLNVDNWTDGDNWYINWQIASHDNALWLQYKAVPEPSTYFMVMGIIATIAYRLRKKLKQVQTDDRNLN